MLDKHIAIGGAHGEAQKIKDHLNGGGDDHHHKSPGCCSIKIYILGKNSRLNFDLKYGIHNQFYVRHEFEMITQTVTKR